MRTGQILAALGYAGRNPIKRAWLMGRASYDYTRSWDGTEGLDGRPMKFTRWYAFKGAVSTGWEYLWRR